MCVCMYVYWVCDCNKSKSIWMQLQLQDTIARNVEKIREWKKRYIQTDRRKKKEQRIDWIICQKKHISLPHLGSLISSLSFVSINCCHFSDTNRIRDWKWRIKKKKSKVFWKVVTKQGIKIKKSRFDSSTEERPVFFRFRLINVDNR